MASAQTSEVFNCTPQEFYKIVSDYERYPEFLQEVKGCKVIKSEGSRKLVEYTVSLMKNFKYSLWMTEVEPSSVSWEFAGGDIFKGMTGSWKMEEEGGKCRSTYHINAEFNLLVPGPLAKALVSVNLPNMVSAYQKRVSELYGR